MQEKCSTSLAGFPSQTAAPVPEPTACPRCGVMASHRITPAAPPHAWKMTCTEQACGAFIKWYSTKPQAEREASREHHRQAAMAGQDATPLQLSFISALGGSVSAVSSRLSASRMIDFLKGRGIA